MDYSRHGTGGLGILWTMNLQRSAIGYLAAVAGTTVSGSIAQTQFNLAALQELGAPIPLDLRLHTTVQDLIGFAPLFAALVAAALLVAFVVAGLLLRRLPLPVVPLYTLAGAMAMLVLLLIMDAMLPVTPIAAARSPAGLLVLSLSGALGGLLFAAIARRMR